MKTIFYILFMFSTLIPMGFINASEKNSNIWTMHVVENAEFPWWEEIRHPLEINLSKNGHYYIDQYGTKCVPSVFFYDTYSKQYIFKSCGSKKSQQAFEIFFRAKLNGDSLIVEVWTFRQLFILKSNQRGRSTLKL